MLEDSEAKAVVIHSDLLERVGGAIPPSVPVLAVRTPPEIASAYGIKAPSRVPDTAIEWDSWRDGFAPQMGPPPGTTLSIIYTSGTTGHPKGVKRPPFTEEEMGSIAATLSVIFGLTYFEDPSRIVTAVVGPMYHSAPNMHAMFSFRVGADVHLCPRFDPEGLLALIDRERITHLHLVPIMFERLLKLPQEVRARYDVSSLRFVVHAAAPCSPATKRAMIDWWGPIVHEYYGSTEIGPVTFLTAEEWLEGEGRDPDAFPMAKRAYVAIDRPAEEVRAWFGAVYGGGVPPEVAITGSAGRVVEGLRELREAGADLLVVAPVGDDRPQLELIVEHVLAELG